ncbi:MAG: hypothetical protein ACJ74T_03080 [Pyrinomonadaceae bacterium]
MMKRVIRLTFALVALCCAVYTTVELVIGEIESVRFTREQDAQSGYKELRVTRRAARRSRR